MALDPKELSRRVGQAHRDWVKAQEKKKDAASDEEGFYEDDEDLRAYIGKLKDE